MELQATPQQNLITDTEEAMRSAISEDSCPTSDEISSNNSSFLEVDSENSDSTCTNVDVMIQPHPNDTEASVLQPITTTTKLSLPRHLQFDPLNLPKVQHDHSSEVRYPQHDIAELNLISPTACL